MVTSWHRLERIEMMAKIIAAITPDSGGLDRAFLAFYRDLLGLEVVFAGTARALYRRACRFPMSISIARF